MPYMVYLIVQLAFLLLFAGRSNSAVLEISPAAASIGNKTSKEYVDDYAHRVIASSQPLMKFGLDHFTLSLGQIINNSLADPCKASLFSNLGWIAGFGSKISCLINEIWLPAYALAVQSTDTASQGADPSWALCWSGDFLKTFSQYFDLNHLPLCRQGCADRAEGIKEGLPGYAYGTYDAVEQIMKAYGDDGPQVIAMQRSVILRYFFKYLPDTEKFLAEKRQVMPRPYIGLHIRRGDKGVEAAPIGSDKYAEQVKSSALLRAEARKHSEHSLELPKKVNYSGKYVDDVIRAAAKTHNITDVFLASDDPNALEQMRVLLQGELSVTAFNHSSDYSDVTDQNYGHDTILKTLLADLYLLQSSTIFIGTGSSNIGRIVFLERGADYQSTVSLDKPFDSSIV